MFRLFCYLYLLCCLQVFASPKSQITILTADKSDIEHFYQPEPFSISVDTSNLLLEHLNQYQLKLRQYPLPRIERLLESEQNYCMFNRVKNPHRAKHTLFSLPLNLYPGLRLYMLAPTEVPREQLNNQGQLKSLAELLTALPGQQLGVSKGRSYGAYLDEQLKLVPGKSLFVRAGAYRYDAILKMLNAGKLSFIIEFPTEIYDTLHLIKQPKNLRSVAIANVPAYLKSYVACSYTEDNRTFILEVNRTLRQLYNSKDFYRAHSRYIMAAERDAFNREYQLVFSTLIID